MIAVARFGGSTSENLGPAKAFAETAGRNADRLAETSAPCQVLGGFLASQAHPEVVGASGFVGDP